MVHPLQNSWTFWEHRKSSADRRNADKDYGHNMYRIGDFDTVEDFWRFKNNLPNPSEIFFTSSSPGMKFADRTIEGYSLFKTGIKPEWEDPQNKNGGEICCRQRFESSDLDLIYETLLLGLIGETVDPADEICGCRFVDKSKQGRALYRVEVWYKTDTQDMRKTMEENVKKCLRREILKEHKSHGHSLRKA